MKRPPPEALPPRPVFLWPCGCTLDDPDEDEVCPTHMHLAVVRDGAALRTGDELGEQFIEDATDLLTTPVTPGGEVPVAWGSVLARCAEDHAVHGQWLDDEDLREELHDIEREAEDALTTAGWTVLWSDGYVIWRPTADAPAVLLRAKRDQEAALP